MAGIMRAAALLSLLGTTLFALGYRQTSYAVLLAPAITCGTTFYHLAMRLLLGFVVGTAMRNKADYSKRRYQVGKTEMAIYEKLRVKKWKSKMPTYDTDLFDPRLHSWEEIAQAMCQAELIHKAIAILSFLPIAAGSCFGAYPVFIITSVLAAAFDSLFVIMQRYNRQRIMRLLQHKSKAQN